MYITHWANTIVFLLLANLVFTGFPGNRDPDPDFKILKPSHDSGKSNDIRYSPIGSAVFDLLNDSQTDKHPVTLNNGIQGES